MNEAGEILLDNSVVIEYLRHQPETHQRLQSATMRSSDQATAERYGRIKMQLAHADTPIPQNDIWIGYRQALLVARRNEGRSFLPRARFDRFRLVASVHPECTFVVIVNVGNAACR